MELFPFVILNGFCKESFLNILLIDGISSNLANTFLSSRQICIIKTKELGANAIVLFPFVILNNAMAFVYMHIFSLTFCVLI